MVIESLLLLVIVISLKSKIYSNSVNDFGKGESTINVLSLTTSIIVLHSKSKSSFLPLYAIAI